MRQVSITVPVWILEASDVETVNEQARVDGTINDAALPIAEALPNRPGVTVGYADGRYGPTAHAIVGGHRLEIGDGYAIHPALPLGAAKVSAALLEDADGAGEAEAVAEVAPTPDDEADGETEPVADEPETAKPKATVKKAAKTPPPQQSEE